MEESKEPKEILQWHPAFFAGLQIELEQDAENLIFESEHQLGNKPKAVDVLIIKKRTNVSVKKNIGKIFRGHNIIEYKSPTDYLNVDDFYKVYGYACFYKSLAKKIDEISVEELTITFVCTKYPRSMMKHLTKVRRFEIQQKEAGIYHIIGDMIPMQLVVASELSQEENLWIRSLTNDLKDDGTIQKLVEKSSTYKESKLYRSILDIIVKANKKRLQEDSNMTDALEELFKDKLEQKEENGRKEGREEGREEGEWRRLIKQIQKKMVKNVSAEDCAEMLEENTEIVKEIYAILKDNPTWDDAAISKWILVKRQEVQ